MEEFEIISRWRDSTFNPRCEVNSKNENHISDAEDKRRKPSKKDLAATWLRGNLQKLDDGLITLLVEGNYLERVEMVGGVEEGLGWGVNKDGLTNYSKGDNLPLLIIFTEKNNQTHFCKTILTKCLMIFFDTT